MLARRGFSPQVESQNSSVRRFVRDVEVDWRTLRDWRERQRAMKTNIKALPRQWALALSATLWLILAAWAVGATSAAHAAPEAAPWCAAMGGQSGAWDCSYYTFEQCMATARGLGNMCAPNPYAARIKARSPQRRSPKRPGAE